MQERILAMEADEKAKGNTLKRNAVYVRGLESGRTSAMPHRTKLDLDFRELEEQFMQGKEVLVSNKEESVMLNWEIGKVERELPETVQLTYDNARNKMMFMANEREEARIRIEGLYAKQGPGKQFKMTKERDSHLRSQIGKLTTSMSEKEELLNKKQTKLSSLRRSLAAKGKEAKEKRKELKEKSKILDNLVRNIDKKKRVQKKMADSCKEQGRGISELSSKVKDAQESSCRAMYDVCKSMPRATSQGVDTLKQIVVGERLTVGVQYFGLIQENFELTNDKYSTAMKVAAQNSLFHIIVNTDATATRLMKRLEDNKLGKRARMKCERQVHSSMHPAAEEAKAKARASGCLDKDTASSGSITISLGVGMATS